MTDETTYQCEQCNRQHDGAGGLILMRWCVPQLMACGREDCGQAAAVQRQRAAARDQERHARRVAKAQAQPCRSESKVAVRQSLARIERPVREVLAASESEFNAADEAALMESGNAIGTNVGAVVEQAFEQRNFQASGLADSQNAKLREFFERPENFGLWFKGRMLEELSGATRMNNRAVDLRPYFLERGLYLDNRPIADKRTGVVASCYRLCKIADALSLSDEQKEKFLGNDQAER